MMTKPSLYILLLLFAAVVSAGHTASPSSQASRNAAVGKDACLGCHGPFDKLVAGPKTFVSESGEKINPHWYVPHDRRDAKSVPECVNCHKPHPLPVPAKGGLPKADVEWCQSCHHTGDLKACKACH